MAHSLTKIWIHLIFGTKDRIPLINNSYEEKLYSHIRNKMKQDFDCPVKSINGIEDHIHVLFLQNPIHSVADIVKGLKGESSYWINNNGFIKQKFLWQTGYGAFSVSESKLSETEKYISNQKEHHKQMSFMEEYELFMKKYGFNLINR